MKKDEVINIVQIEMKDIHNFYQSSCLNWQGKTDDTDESIQEIVASEILHNLHKFKQVTTVPVKNKYTHNKLNKLTISLSSGKDYFKRFIGLNFEDLGTIKDCHIPIIDAPIDTNDFIDVISYDEANSTVYLIESHDLPEISLLKSLVSIYMKSKSIDQKKLLNNLLNDFEFILNQKFNTIKIDNLKIVPVVLYQEDNESEEVSFIEEDHKKLHALFLALGVDLLEFGFNVYNRLV